MKTKKVGLSKSGESWSAEVIVQVPETEAEYKASHMAKHFKTLDEVFDAAMRTLIINCQAGARNDGSDEYVSSKDIAKASAAAIASFNGRLDGTIEPSARVGAVSQEKLLATLGDALKSTNAAIKDEATKLVAAVKPHTSKDPVFGSLVIAAEGKRLLSDFYRKLNPPKEKVA